jgi:hypothetical protein
MATLILIKQNSSIIKATNEVQLLASSSSQRSSEMARNWRGLCPAVHCSGLMMMMMVKINYNYNLFCAKVFLFYIMHVINT